MKKRQWDKRGVRPAPELWPLFHELKELFPEWAQRNLSRVRKLCWNIGMTYYGGRCHIYFTEKQRIAYWLEVGKMFSEEQQRATLLHEMVHAGAKAMNHGPAFKALASRVGAERYVPNEEGEFARTRKAAMRVSRMLHRELKQDPRWQS